jgi:hypothetical protein
VELGEPDHYHMTLDPDHGFGLLSPEDHEKMELILTERSHGSYGAPALHGMLAASVVELASANGLGTANGIKSS